MNFEYILARIFIYKVEITGGDLNVKGFGFPAWRSLVRKLVNLFPTVTVLLEYFDPAIYSCVVFELHMHGNHICFGVPCNSIPVNAFSFIKPQKV